VRGVTARPWLTCTEITELVALRTDAPVETVPNHGRQVWLRHGNSISQGSDAETDHDLAGACRLLRRR
jgi:hypothetical protein